MTARTLSKVTAFAIAGMLWVAPAVAIDPPARFAHAYSGQLVINRVPVDQARDRCAVFGSFACAFTSENRCEVWIPRVGDRIVFLGARIKVTEGFLRGVLAHEIAHCNGWPADHPA